ncbi:hypothetical protein V6N13_067504 [Hibiscus sabdariffa]|uniref:GDSL esterase/lipase n=1 Tax=Hibiscus sabdariffa TaxID=183260 RepID=A0ABR2DTM7_9ROSI
MEGQSLVLFFIFISVFSGDVEGGKRMFVFGDSYADTGNNRIALAAAWKYPYGITFPGKPAGRFSDGRVSTDFIGKLLYFSSLDDEPCNSW